MSIKSKLIVSITLTAVCAAQSSLVALIFGVKGVNIYYFFVSNAILIILIAYLLKEMRFNLLVLLFCFVFFVQVYYIFQNIFVIKDIDMSDLASVLENYFFVFAIIFGPYFLLSAIMSFYNRAS